ncbi:hypothetical protein CDD83_3731 [Cordyceps sp. RAO-2017]|nr:hypothetical protein CDD83_3731 [Cordyceps sp. RAO-2017]
MYIPLPRRTTPHPPDYRYAGLSGTDWPNCAPPPPRPGANAIRGREPLVFTKLPGTLEAGREVRALFCHWVSDAAAKQHEATALPQIASSWHRRLSAAVAAFYSARIHHRA